ncbi:hypothetical protein FKW77_009652 [Venturia effusa]|uniref:Uncharacterized protein n=1 Tax=Venturia effusa TaxID=50376 RepID=A0A517L216_9PEZI|nr:hypothetical protein FKW77_009652 [Venturia effusa]
MDGIHPSLSGERIKEDGVLGPPSVKDDPEKYFGMNTVDRNHKYAETSAASSQASSNSICPPKASSYNQTPYCAGHAVVAIADGMGKMNMNSPPQPAWNKPPMYQANGHRNIYRRSFCLPPDHRLRHDLCLVSKIQDIKSILGMPDLISAVGDDMDEESVPYKPRADSIDGPGLLLLHIDINSEDSGIGRQRVSERPVYLLTVPNFHCLVAVAKDHVACLGP